MAERSLITDHPSDIAGDRSRARIVREALIALACDTVDERTAEAMIYLATRATSERLARLARMLAE